MYIIMRFVGKILDILEINFVTLFVHDGLLHNFPDSNKFARHVQHNLYNSHKIIFLQNYSSIAYHPLIPLTESQSTAS